MTLLVLLAAGFAAGFVNAIAGGGTLLSFPALMFGGLTAIVANATNTLALVPGAIASAWVYRQRLRENRQLIITYGVPSVIGGLAGAVLLLATTEKLFRAIVPFLILLACVLLVLNEPIGRWMTRRANLNPKRHAILLWGSQLVIGIYGGYFGAGIGIMMLAAMAIFLPEDLQTANALKAILAVVINGTALVYFIVAGKIDYQLGAIVAVAAIAGGYVGAHVAQKLSPRWLRAVVVVYGAAIALYMLGRG
ncbi:MAG: putative membrane transporter protein YfcA [Verrucomicrobiae bacterium]|nr:putative membrane transporter protein YfcA [Verrucomicrobiae bacterium]